MTKNLPLCFLLFNSISLNNESFFVLIIQEEPVSVMINFFTNISTKSYTENYLGLGILWKEKVDCLMLLLLVYWKNILDKLGIKLRNSLNILLSKIETKSKSKLSLKVFCVYFYFSLIVKWVNRSLKHPFFSFWYIFSVRAGVQLVGEKHS